MQNISGFGLQVRVVASKTFPSGFTVTAFADDSDPFDFPSQQVADKAMGINGDLVVWSKANPLNITLSVIPDSEDDKNLGALLEANRAAKGKAIANDEITLTAIYPSGSQVTLNSGAITDGIPRNSVGNSGRFKSKPYTFAFENVTGA